MEDKRNASESRRQETQRKCQEDRAQGGFASLAEGERAMAGVEVLAIATVTVEESG